LFYVCRFYESSLEKKLIDKLPFKYETRSGNQAPGYLEHVNATGGRTKTNDAMPRADKQLPKYFTIDGIKSLLGACTNVHHRAFIRFGLQTGLRRMELATFPVAYIKRALRAPGDSRNVLLRLNPNDGHGIKTKRNKPRNLWVSRTLLEEADRYIVQRRGERILSSDKDCGRLFVNQNGEAYAGKGKAFEKIVRDIGRLVGLEANPHMLRHTYATHTLVSLQRSKSANDPLVFLKNQLGHSSIYTTMIYAHLVDDFVDDAVLEYDDELNGLDAHRG
jgi:integrase